MSHKLHQYLGEVEQKIATAKATGSDDSTRYRLMELLPHTTLGKYNNQLNTVGKKSCKPAIHYLVWLFFLQEIRY